MHMKITKIAITGHTKGIGNGIFSKFKHMYSVQGFSRSNGYDIANDEILKQIVNQTLDCEVFINNAYCYDQQTKLAELWSYAHRNKDHVIINISSLAADPIFKIPEKIPELSSYAKEKLNLNEKTFEICDQAYKCKAISILLGIVETDLENSLEITAGNLLNHYKILKEKNALISVNDVADSIEFLINSLKQNCFIYSISILNKF